MGIESEKQRIYEFVEKGNYHAAINLAISALNECRRNNDQAGVDTFISISKHVINKMAEEFGIQ
jgi:predicted aconitase